MRIFVFVIALALCIPFSLPAAAEGNDIAVVNVDRVMSITKAAKDIEKQLKAKQEEYQKEAPRQ